MASGARGAIRIVFIKLCFSVCWECEHCLLNAAFIDLCFEKGRCFPGAPH